MPLPIHDIPTLIHDIPILIPADIVRATTMTLPAAPQLCPTPLAITWYPTPAPPASTPPVSPTQATASVPLAQSPPPITVARRGRRPCANIAKRSKRLADKEPAQFLDMTTRTVQLKALKNNISACSKELQAHVSHRKIMCKTNPLATVDLNKLAVLAGLP